LWFLGTVLELTLVFGAIEMALRGSNESIRSHLPELEATDANPMSSASRSVVCADQSPVILSPITPHKHLVHDYSQIRERSHKGLSDFGDCGAPNRWRAIIDGERAMGGMEGGDACAVVAAPRGGVTLGKVAQLVLLHFHTGSFS
jgi:hypothetical protein